MLDSLKRYSEGTFASYNPHPTRGVSTPWNARSWVGGLGGKAAGHKVRIWAQKKSEML